jgi:hypothetical protein
MTLSIELTLTASPLPLEDHLGARETYSILPRPYWRELLPPAPVADGLNRQSHKLEVKFRTFIKVSL